MATIGDTEIQKILENIQSIPTFSEIVNRVLLKLYEPNISMSEIAKDISVDAALVSKVFKLVNSAYYGFPRKITTMTQAIVILGFNAIKSILLTTTVVSLFKVKEKTPSLDWARFWEHSLGCAVASKVIARRLGIKNEEELFFAGLLHDFGKLVLRQYFPNRLAQIVESRAAEEIPFHHAERKILGTDHAEIGKWLCERWNFPLIFREAVAWHHYPEQAIHSLRKAVYIVHLGNAVAKWEQLGDSGNSQDLTPDMATWDELGLDELEINMLSDEIHAEYEKSNIFLELMNE